MALIQVEYTVPLTCLVDTDAGEITRVTLFGEQIQRSGEFYDGRGNPVRPDPSTERALAIVQDCDWPSWDRR
jgi:hypothetical protein